MPENTTNESAQRVNQDSFVRLEFDIRWESETAEHRELFLARRSNVWRDIFPPGLEEAILGSRPGDTVSRSYEPGQAVPAYESSLVKERRIQAFRPAMDPKQRLKPCFGRFYPKGFLLYLPGIFPENTSPFRVIGLEEGSFIADLNHPLALYALEIRVDILEVAEKFSDVGGRCNAWMEEVLDRGPGMQARWQGQPTDFFQPGAFRREDEGDDALFHARPRLVRHLDAQASAFIQEEYTRFLQPGMAVLDLMSSLESHLPAEMDLEVTGLGMNQEELDANPRLSRSVIHDLNERPELPFPEQHFDLVVCSLSIEYLVHPLKVLREVYRVLKPDGPCLISFSNRWHAPKAIALWSELSEFERLGLVQEYLLQAGGFEGVSTFSRRNWWRPDTDRYAAQLQASDPVYLITARRSRYATGQET